MENPISRAEHIEFVKRMEEEHHRMNKRLEVAEQELSELRKMTVNVERLASNMERMLEEQERQGERLERLESKPGDNWNTVIRSMLTGLGTTIAGALLGGLAMFFLK